MSKDKKLLKVKKYSSFGLGKEKDYFIENMGMLVDSGMDIYSVFDAIEKEVRTSKMKKIIATLRQQIESGTSLSTALESIGFLSKHTVSLVRIGEESGRLPENLRLIAEQEEKDRTFKSKIRSAMMYPVFIFFLTIAIGIGISWFILPQLADVFLRLSAEVPLITRVLLGFGQFLGEYGYIAVPSFLFVTLFFMYFIFVFGPTKFIGQKLLFVFPGAKRLMQEVEIARLGYLLGILIEAGVPIVDALDSLSKATTIRSYQKFYRHVKTSVEDGHSFEESFHSYKKSRKLVPTPIQGMIAAGEKSGKLSETLRRIGRNFEAKTEITTKNLAVIMEPILLVIVWAGVVLVALAVIMPIYGLIGSLNR